MASTQTTYLGRRKTSVARLQMSSGEGQIVVNGKPIEQYFTVPRMMQHATEGLKLSGKEGSVNLRINVRGGGISSQSGAVRLALARALQTENPQLREPLKKAGLLTRDPRMVERKKYGLRKARRGTQFSKR
ncbi:MAG: 30S ribosomal protein S9 [Spirochaetaceae bacterium]|nr:30S ribosomal protein S9 [Spirochaetaceae bacterium]